MHGVDRVELDLLLPGESSKEGMRLAIVVVIFHAVDRSKTTTASGSVRFNERCDKMQGHSTGAASSQSAASMIKRLP